MRPAPLRTLAARPGTPLSRSSSSTCPRDVDCSCQDSRVRPPLLCQASKTAAIHVDHCHDPDCHEVEQLKALQKSLDHFTDYDHYERCCDGHHHVSLGKEECRINPNGNHCSPAAEQCEDFDDDCDECIDEHKNCYEEVDVCDDDCEQCEVECEERGHEPEDCPRDHPTTRDNCDPACHVKHTPLPQLGPTSEFDAHAMSGITHDIKPCTDECSVPVAPAYGLLAVPLQGISFDSEMDHWQTFVQAHHCAPDPCMIGQPPQVPHPQHMDPSFGFTFGCDPTIPGNQYPWQRQTSPCNVPLQKQSLFPTDPSHISNGQKSSLSTMFKRSTSPTSSEVGKPLSSASTPSTSSSTLSKTCEWVMPCGSICGAAFTRTDHLKKHIKNSHTTKGITTCNWTLCTASFATEAALTGHISKKHLTSSSDEDAPWKCTYPGCTKSFMYKQVRDDHLASHNGGNRMHCPICHQWLNCEGSNFRRHMASHGPKNEYMKCRFEAVGCKKRFPRLDNLRRHEACCKFGKRAAGIHHHHHTVHVGHVT